MTYAPHEAAAARCSRAASALGTGCPRRAGARRRAALFPGAPAWYDGLDAFRRVGDKHAAPREPMFVVAAANPSARPRGAARGGSNEDEITAKEVR